MSWSDVFQGYFYELSQNEINTWEQELNTKMSRLTPDEIETAVRSMAECQRTGQQKRRPNLNTLISAIIRSRHAARQGEIMPSGECSMCGNTGWMPYLALHDLKDGTRTMGIPNTPHPGQAEYDEAVPCLCSRGEKALTKNYPPDKHDEIRHIAEHVKRARAA